MPNKRYLFVGILSILITMMCVCFASPIITILTPLNTSYTTTTVNFNWTSDVNLTWATYSLDGNTNITQSEVSTFNDSTTSKQYTFTDTNTFITYYIEVPKGVFVDNAKIKIKGTNYTVSNERINSSEDSFVDSGIPNNNYGTLEYLHVYNCTSIPRYKYGFLKYPIDTTQYSFMSAIDATVFFNDYETPYGYNGVPTNVYEQPNTAWTELGITWNNKPSSGTIIGTLPYNAGHWHSIDITDYVNEIGNNKLALELISVDDTNSNKKWASKETEQKSYIKLDYYSTKPTIQINVGNDNHNDIDTATTGSYVEHNLNITAIQNYIDNICTTNTCNVPLNITASVIGILDIKDVDVSWNLTSMNTTSSGLSEGGHNIIVWGNDTSGYVNSTAVYFTIDTTPPVITIQSPTNTTYDTDNIWFNITANENLDWCGYSLNGATNISMNNDTTKHFYAQNTTMTEGSHYISFSCNDTAGNMNSTSTITYFTVDTTPPIVTIHSPTNRTYTSSDILLNWSVNEDSTYAKYSLNGGTNISNSDWCYQETANISTACGGLDTGTYTLEYTSGDSGVNDMIDEDWDTYCYAGKLHVNYTKPISAYSNSLWRIKDGYSPVIYYNVSLTSACWNAYLDKIVLRTMTTGGGFSYYGKYYCYDGSAWIELKSIYVGELRGHVYEEAMWWDINRANDSITLTGLPEGSNNIILWATDNAGHENHTTIYFTVDTTEITVLPTTRTKAITNGSTDIFNISVLHDASVPRNITFTCLEGAICEQPQNFTVTFENASLNVNASETKYNEVNITTNSSLPAGTYNGTIQVKYIGNNKTQNITLTYSSNEYASDIRMKDTYLTSLTMDSDDTVARTIYYNNTGDWNGTHCNFTISSLSSYTTFSDQDFTIEVGDDTWYSTTMTISSPAVGTYSNLQVKLECTAYISGELDSDISYIDVSVTSAPAPPAGGGGTTTIIYGDEDELGKPYDVAVYKKGGRYIPNLPVVINDCTPPTYEKRYAITIENRDDEAFVPKFSTSEGLEGYVTVVDDEEPLAPYSKKDYILIMTTRNETIGKILEGAIYVSAGSTTVQIDGKWIIDTTCVTGLNLSGLFDYFKQKFFKVFMSFAGFNFYWGYLITLLAVLAIQQSKIKKESDKLQYRVTILAVALVALWMI